MQRGYFELTEDIIKRADDGMNNLIKNNIKIDFKDISTYEFPLDEPFGLQVFYKNTIYCFVIKFSSKNKNLICAGPGAHERFNRSSNGELIKPPFFDRRSWYIHFKESFIAYADPMIFYNDDIKITWFVGTKEEWYLENLSHIIKELCINQNIINENILFFGSSGGGFTSVVLGTLIKNSKVLINNSQLFILNYNEGMVNQLFDMLYNSFEGMSKEEIINEIKYRLDVIELFKKENYAPFITYYVNVDSEPDVLNHGLPLLQKIYKLKQFNGLDVHYYREIKEVPHEPMPTKITIKTIKIYCKNHLYNTFPNEKKDGNIFIDEKYIDELLKRNKKLKKENKKLFNSKSWKITAPLRKIINLFRSN